MKSKGIYNNLEKEMAIANVRRIDLEKVLPFNLNTLTSKLSGKSEITLNEATIIRDYLEKHTGKKFELEYLFELE